MVDKPEDPIQYLINFLKRDRFDGKFLLLLFISVFCTIDKSLLFLFICEITFIKVIHSYNNLLNELMSFFTTRWRSRT